MESIYSYHIIPSPGFRVAKPYPRMFFEEKKSIEFVKSESVMSIMQILLTKKKLNISINQY